MRHSRLMLVDVGGALAVLGCLGALVWLAFLRGDATVAEMESLDRNVSAMRRDLSDLRATEEAEQDDLDRREQELVEEGNLPDRAPIEEDLDTLTQLAHEHGVTVTQVQPMAAREYPGLSELRYQLQARGRMAGLIRFFRAIEDADLWADISYLQVEQMPGGSHLGEDDRLAVITISLFSAGVQADPATGDDRDGTG